MSEQDIDIELRTHSEDADDYIKQLKDETRDLPDAEKVKILLGKVRYWYGSAIEWRGFYEVEIQRRKEI